MISPTTVTRKTVNVLSEKTVNCRVGNLTVISRVAGKIYDGLSEYATSCIDIFNRKFDSSDLRRAEERKVAGLGEKPAEHELVSGVRWGLGGWGFGGWGFS